MDRKKMPLDARLTHRSLALRAVLVTSTAGAALLTGCGLGTSPTNEITSALAVQGRILGGSQPVKSSTVRLYAASQTGYAGAATVLTTTTSDANGNFSITGTYTCPANSLVYITANGGDPGTGQNNPQIAMAAALGSCSGTLSAGLFININEVTTVATAYALSGFATSLTNIGTSSTNTLGLQNAMATVNNIVNITNGSAMRVTPAYQANNVAGTNTSIVPTATINSLADILTSCMNSNGGASGDGSACGNLFAAIPGTPVATDTFQAALNLAKNPGKNVAAVYNLLPPLVGAPFQPTLTAQPNDWTLSVTYIGGGLGETTTSDRASATDLKIDASGNVWLPSNHNARIIELSNLGAPLSPSTTTSAVGGYSAAGISNPSQIAIDLEGDAWVNQDTSVAAVTPAGSTYPGSPFTDPSLTSAKGITIDGLDNVWVPSLGNSTVVKFNHAGAVQSAAGFTSSIVAPNGAIAIDGNENAYVVNGNSTITELSNAGALVATGNPGAAVNGPAARMAVDNSGNEYLPQPGISNSILKATGVATTNSGVLYSPASVVSPVAVAIDGAGNIFSINSGGQPSNGNAAVPANLTELTSTGTVLSTLGTGFTLNATSPSPQGVGVDGSGNVWVVNLTSPTGTTGASTVQEFIGVGAPTVTPIALAVKNKTLATRP